MNTTSPLPCAPGRPDTPTIGTVEHLGGRGALYLLSLLRAHHARIRVAPTQEGTQAVLSVLDALGIIRLDPQAQVDCQIAIGEKIAWAYTWPQVPLGDLEDRLAQYLRAEGQTPAYAHTWLRVWQELLSQEVTAYLQHQLRRHQFADTFLSELAPLLVPHESRFSLGHWRYACWASVRSMASVSLQYPGNAQILKFTLGRELARRLELAQGSLEGKLCFSPSYSLPDCAMTSVFSTIATPLRDKYWICPPSLGAL